MISSFVAARWTGSVAVGRLPVVMASLSVLLLLVGAPASAGQPVIEEAKASGFIGEQADGYLGLVSDGASDAIKAVVEATNIRRKEKYEKVSAKNGVPIETVAKMAGNKRITRASPGSFVKGSDGNWVKAP